MAEKKKSSGAADDKQSRAELAETLRRAAAELETAHAEGAAQPKPAAKKPAAKKPAAKPAASKSTAASSKAPAKKPTTKKPATKAVPAAKPAQAEQPEQQPPEQPAVEEKPVVEQQPVVEQHEQPVVEEKPTEQPVQPEQPVQNEQTVEQQPVDQPVAAQQPVQSAAAQAQPARTSGRGTAFAQKSNDFINNKGKLPLFIIANLLLLLSSIFLLARAFDIPSATGKAITGNLFTYYGNRTAIIAHWQATAGAWASGGYTMMGILMFFSFLVPLALVVKNAVFFVLKKDKNVHMFDAIIVFAFLVAYLGVVNLYGANMTWSHILSLIMSIILLAFTVFVIIIETRGKGYAMPYFSIANIVMVILCMFLLTSNKIYNAAGWYAAHAAAASGGGGFAFIMLLVSLAALVVLVVMQVKKLPGKIEYLFEFIIPAVAGGCALIALIGFAGGKPTGLGMGGGFVFGCILTLLFAAADIVFAVVPKLHKYNVKVTDRMIGDALKPVTPAAPSEEQAASTEQPAAPAQPAEPVAPAQPVEQPAEPVASTLKCPACGQENEVGTVFCAKCGRKMKNN